MDCCWLCVLVLVCFKLLPTFPFCTSSSDPCSCRGAGFEIYAPLCNDNTNSNGTDSINSKVTAAKREYPGIFEALAGKMTIILVSIGTIGFVIILFSFARTCYALTKVNNKRARAEKLVSQLEKKTAEVTRQLKLNTLNAKQGKMVDEKAQSFEAQIPPYFKLALADIQFEKLLGSGA